MAISLHTSFLLLFAFSTFLLLPTKIPATRALTPTAAPGPGPAPAPAPAPVITTNPEEQEKLFIQVSCSKTRYPDVCYKTLEEYAADVEQDPARLANYAINVSLTKAREAARFISSVHKQGNNDKRIEAALKDCQSTFNEAVDEMRQSLGEMSKPKMGTVLRFQLSNVQTWMSAALTNESTCEDDFNDEQTTGLLKSDMISRVAEMEQLTSNALALVNSYADSVMAQLDL